MWWQLAETTEVTSGRAGPHAQRVGSQAEPFLLRCPLGSLALIPQKPFPVSPQCLSQDPQPSNRLHQ